MEGDFRTGESGEGEVPRHMFDGRGPDAHQGHPIGINLSREVKQEAERSVGARADDVGLGGPLGSPAEWGGGRVSARYQ